MWNYSQSSGDLSDANGFIVATGMTATVSPDADPGVGLTWQAFISAADTITVRYCNVTTGSITPAAAMLQVRVIQ